MIAGDVRTLAREYCERGDAVQYTQYPLGHVTTAVPWVTAAIPWLTARFAGTPGPPELRLDRTRQLARPDRRIASAPMLVGRKALYLSAYRPIN